jgi:hypothetical protein
MRDELYYSRKYFPNISEQDQESGILLVLELGYNGGPTVGERYYGQK